MSQLHFFGASERSDITSRYSECALHFRGADCRLLAVGGSPPTPLTFARTSKAWALDAAGRWREVNYGIERWVAVDTDGDGVYDDCGILLEAATTNLVKGSENVGGADWTNVGAATITLGVATSGALTFARLQDTSAGAVQFVQQGVSAYTNFVTGTPGVLSVHLMAPTVNGAHGNGIALWDSTASVYRALATITWSGGVPTVTATPGTALPAIALGDGVWWVRVLTTAVTTANAHIVFLLPSNASFVADVGDMFVGGVQLTGGSVPQSHIVTPIGALATRAVELLTVPALWTVLDTETWYVKLARPSWFDVPSGTALSNSGGAMSPYLLSRGSGGGPRLSIYGPSASGARNYAADVTDTVPAATASGVATPSAGALTHELCAEFSQLTTVPRVRLDAGAGFSSFSAATILPVASGAAGVTWAAVLQIGDAAWGTGNSAGSVLLVARAVRAARTLAQMREAW